MATPIWKDYEVTLGTGDSHEFTIRTSSSVSDIIYSGKAWKRPGETSVKIFINDICADYMRQQLPNLATDGLQACDGYIKTFYVYAGDTQKAEVQFLYDYSYDYVLAGLLTDYAMSDPVDGIIDINMPLVHTMRSSIASLVYYETDNSFDLSFDLSFDILNEITTSITGLGNYVRATQPEDIGHSIRFEEAAGYTTYTILDTCARYALYYVNEYGGWDSLVMRGGFRRTDKYKRYETKRNYNNSVAYNRGRLNYANEETFALELRTAFLTDDQASRMHHLIGSNMVYMYDLSTGVLQPVIITDNSCEYKTYKNQGLKMVQYAINVEIAQEMTRR